MVFLKNYKKYRKITFLVHQKDNIYNQKLPLMFMIEALVHRQKKISAHTESQNLKIYKMFNLRHYSRKF